MWIFKPGSEKIENDLVSIVKKDSYRDNFYNPISMGIKYYL